MDVPYNDAFFDDQRRESTTSAREIVPVVLKMVKPQSVVDVGCGIGAWLSVFKEHGVRDVLGIDGAWVNGYRGLPPEEFLERDLSQPLSLGRMFDLVVSLEVAEHLPPTSAKLFVESLVGLGSTILFSAAAPLQGGTNHLNEQWPKYWAALFAEHGYVALDWLRPLIWNNERVEWYYAQNSLLFVHAERVNAIPRPEGSVTDATVPLSLVHPRNYLEKARRANVGLSEVIALSPSLIRDAVLRRLPHLRNRQPR
jgi:SAM-dependent methyltransferase